MKTLLLASLGLVSSTHFAAADVTSKLIGTWSGKVSELEVFIARQEASLKGADRIATSSFFLKGL